MVKNPGAEMARLHSDKTFDLVVSEVLVVLAPALVAFTLLLVLRFSWELFPAVVVSVLVFGLACLGLRRYVKWSRSHGERRD